MKPGFKTPQEMAAVDASVIDYIQQYQRDNGYPPSRRDIAAHLGSVPSTAQQALERLVRDGLITMVPGQARAIRVTGAAMKAVEEAL